LTGAAAGSGNTIAQTLTNSSTTAQTATYTITPSANACAGTAPITVVITVNPDDDASFNYSSTTYCQTGTNPTPVITGITGGTFSAAPAGIIIDPATGIVDLLGSALNTYTITYTTPGPCINSATFNLTVTNAPSAAFSFAGGTYCQSASPDPFPTFAAGSSGGVFSSTAGLNINSITGQITLATSTAGTYTVTNNIPAGGGCAASTATATVTIDQAAIVTAGIDISICAGSTYLLSGSAGGSTTTILWSSPTAGTFDNANITGATYTPSAADISNGSVVLTITSDDPAGTCPAVTDDILLTIDQAPTVNAGIDTSVCTGNPITLSGTSGGSTTGITWSSPTGGFFSNANAGNSVYNPSAADLSNGSVILTITSNDPAGVCNAVTDDMTLTINPMDDASFTYSGTTFCTTGSNPTPTITGLPGGIFTTSGTITIDPATGVVDLSATSAGTYSITYTTAGTCLNSTTVSITISTAPTASFNFSSGAYCQSAGGIASPVFGTGSAAGTFSSGTGLSLNSTTGDVDIALSTTGTYTIYNNISATGGCAATLDSATIIIDQPATANAGSDTAICAGTTLNVTGVVTGTTGLTWSSAGSGFFDSSTSASTIYTPSSADSLAGSVMIIVTSDDPAGACNAVADTMTLTINSLPDANAGPDQSLTCITTSVVLNGSSTSTGTDFFWTGPSIVSGDSTANPVVSASGNYILAVTNNNGCSTLDSAEILNNITVPDANAGTAQTLTCISNTVNLNGSSTTIGANFIWTGPGIISGDSTALPSVNTGGTYTVTVSDPSNGCTTTATVMVTDNTTPPVADAGPQQTLGCGITNAVLDGSASSSGTNITYNWTTTNGNIISGNTSTQATVDLNGLYTITVVNSDNGCFATDTISVIGAPGSIASFTADPTTGISPLTVNFTNTSTNANTYIWYFGDSTATSTFTDASYIYTAGTYTVTLVASNNSQCPDSAQAIIIVMDDFTFVIPNIFTPNGDDINDLFKVTSTGLESLKANIYDRWGLKLYEWDGISGGWDGRTASGVICPDGTYYYLMTVIGLDGKERFFKGYFQLNR
jgi:gliding motility-associated-like protein